MKAVHFPVLTVPSFREETGTLSVIDNLLPFPIQRVYWIYDARTILRGGHRHKRTRQALIAIRGGVTVHMDDGSHVEDVRLDSPQRCLLVEPKDWHTMRFDEGAILLVLASHPYDLADYIDEPYLR